MLLVCNVKPGIITKMMIVVTIANSFAFLPSAETVLTCLNLFPLQPDEAYMFNMPVSQMEKLSHRVK